MKGNKEMAENKENAQEEFITKFDPTRYDLSNPATALQKIVGDYETLVSSTRQSGESNKEKEKEVRASLEDAKSKKAAEELLISVKEVLNSAFFAEDASPGLPISFFELFNDDLKDYVKEAIEYNVSANLPAEKRTIKIDQNILDVISNLRKLADLIFGMVNVNRLPKAFKEEHTKTNSKGDKVLKVSNAPQNPSEKKDSKKETQTRGRHANTYKYIWTVDGETLPKETTPTEVGVKYLLVGRKAFLELVKKAGYDWTEKTITLTVNGKKVVGKREQQ